MFDHYGLPVKYKRILKIFFLNTQSPVRFNGELSEWFDVKSGTGQGDIQGPPIFNVCINWCSELAVANNSLTRGFPVDDCDECFIVDIDYADDQALSDSTQEGLQETTDNFSKYCAYTSLRINAEKTKSMKVMKNKSQRPSQLNDTLWMYVDGELIEQETEFKYLGPIVSCDGKLGKELDSRIQKASGSFSCLGKIWKNRNIRLCNKVRIYKAAVLTVLCYGCETWNTTVKQQDQLEAFHMRCLRRILKVRWHDMVSNDEILDITDAGKLDDHISRMPLR